MLHLKMILRSWMRNPLSTVISIVSLTVGMVCSTMLVLFAIGEYRVSSSLGNTDRVYLVEEFDSFYQDKAVKSNNTPPNVASKLAGRFGDIEKWATVIDLNVRHTGPDVLNARNYNCDVWGVTSDFSSLFDVPVREGNLEQTLATDGQIAVTDAYMQYVYGRKAVLGDRIKTEWGGNMWINGVQQMPVMQDMIITTILDDNHSTPLKCGGLCKMPEAKMKDVLSAESYSDSWLSVVKLRPEISVDSFKAKIVADAANSIFYGRSDDDILLTPFEDVYFDSSERGHDSFFIRRDPQLLLVGILVAMAVLLIAAFNYINITMTRARARLKNVSGQLIFGATKWQVRRQTVLDTALLVMLSFGLSLLIINALTEQFNAFMESNISLSDLLDWMNLASLGSLLLVLIMLPSIYILVKIEVRRPMETFKNPMGRNIRISSVMVVAQFAISVVMIVFCFNIVRQMNFITSQRPAAHSILVLEWGLPKDFKDRVVALAGVDSHTENSPIPGGKSSSDGKTISRIEGSNQTIEFYEMELLEGRMFEESEREGHVIVNETLLRVFDIPKPAAGQTFFFMNDTLTVVGVVKDFLYEDAHKAIQPLVIKYTGDNQGSRELCLKVNGDVNQRIDEIQALWKEMYPQSINLSIKTVAQIYKDMHKADQRMLTMVEIFMSISMFLTALGLFGLAFYTVARRSKEIALRKIHGSTTYQIILLLCRTFAIWVGVAFIIALPIAYYLSERWLSEFIYRIDITWWVFAATGGVAVVVTFITVIYQTWRAASANPAKSIKAE